MLFRSFVTSGYASNTYYDSLLYGGAIQQATGIAISAATAAGSLVYGLAILTQSSSNSWVIDISTVDSVVANNTLSSGSMNLSGYLDRVRVTSVTSVDTFDAGTVNVYYE